MVLPLASGVGGGGAGGASAHPKVSICQKSGQNLGQIAENPGKMPENLGKNVWLQKMALDLCTETHEDLFWEDTSKTDLYDLCGRKFVGKLTQKVNRQLWENSGKNRSHLQKFACSYTYAAGYRKCCKLRGQPSDLSEHWPRVKFLRSQSKVVENGLATLGSFTDLPDAATQTVPANASFNCSSVERSQKQPSGRQHNFLTCKMRSELLQSARTHSRSRDEWVIVGTFSIQEVRCLSYGYFVLV